MNRPNTTFVALAAITILVLPFAASAGPLAPAPGPVTSTMKTLSEVEPRIALSPANTPGDADSTPSLYKITQPGSYFLTENISMSLAKSAIEVASHNVTIDLNGFEINGNSIGTHGIRSTLSASRGLCIKNGSITGCSSLGIFAEVDRSPSLTGLRISNNLVGARVGDAAVVSHCVFDGNTSYSLHINGGGTVEHCTVKQGGDGFVAQGWTSFADCMATSTSGTGFKMLFGGTLTNCSSSGNAIDGFWVQSGTTISSCNANNNAGVGISLNGGCTATNNSCSGNGTGIRAFNAANRIDSNNVSNNTLLGISSVSDNNFIVRNTARSNGSNYSIPAGDFAQIITSPGNSFVVTNPWANFAY